jgi:hypothetical protein
VTLPMLRFPRSILSLTSLGRAWQALSTVITTSTRSLPMRCSSFGIDFLAGQQISWAVKPSWLCMRVTERVWYCGADALVVNISQTPGVVILEHEVQGNAVRSGKLYENRFISVVTIEDRKIVGWRDYMDSLAAMSSLT